MRTTLQRFLDEVEPADFGPDVEFDDEVDDGSGPWALGDAEDETDLFESGESDDDRTDDWLDEQLARLNTTGRTSTPTSSVTTPTGAGDATADADRADDAPDALEAAAGAGTVSDPAGDDVVLRRPAPRRVRRRRADRDVAGDLPAPDLPGYLRDRRGTWRYAATGRAVPGARDLTLRSLHRFPEGGGRVAVPVDLVRTEAELAWYLAWRHTLTTRLAGGRSVTVVRVPVAEWERRADIPIGLWAPELTASRLLGVAEVARLAGVSPATVTAYLSRRRMPEPVMRLGRAPVWSRPVIRHWLAGRPGQGRRTAGGGRPGGS